MTYFKTLGKRIVVVLVVILIWEICAQYANPLFVPDPARVCNDFIVTIKDGSLFVATIYSFARITIATLLSAMIAIPVGLAVYNFKPVNDLLGPIIGVMRYIPVTSFYPLLIMWFGIDEVMKIAFLFIATFVYMMPSVVLSLEEIDSNLIDTGLTIGMSRVQTISQIQIPAALPSIMNSFIMMYGIGFTYIAVAETVNAKYGLGYMIQQASSRGRTDLVFMSIITIIAVSIIFDSVSKKIVRRIFRWRYIDDLAKQS